MKRKNWPLFIWACKRLDINHNDDNIVYKKNLKNNLLLGLMNLSGVTPMDMLHMLQEIKDELERREGP